MADQLDVFGTAPGPAPGSAYLLRGPSRTAWEHGTPPVDALRYALTFRNPRGER